MRLTTILFLYVMVGFSLTLSGYLDKSSKYDEDAYKIMAWPVILLELRHKT